MIKIAWAFPQSRIGELDEMWNSEGTVNPLHSHSFVTSHDELVTLNPDIVVTNQYDWAMKYCFASENLKWVHFMSSGVDKAVSVLSQRSKPIIITNVKGIHSECMRNYVMAWVLSESQNILHYYRSQQHKDWSRKRSLSLENQVMMIYGYGSIGKAIGSFALSAGMKVIGVKNGAASYDNNNEKVIPSSEVSSHISTCNYFISCVPLTTETHHLFNAAFFNLFKSKPLFINVSRAETVNMIDLKKALKDGKIRSAILDVHDQEPLSATSEYWSHEGIFITPHVAGFAESGLKLGVGKFNRLLMTFISDGIQDDEQVSMDKGY